MGLLPAAFVVPAAVGVVALLKLYRADPATGDARLAWQGGALLLFVSLIFPLQFDREWITLGWALEGCALLWLFHRLPHRGLRLVGGRSALPRFRSSRAESGRPRISPAAATRIWNWYLYAYGITTACLLGGSRLFGKPRENSIDRVGPPLLGSLGVILAFLLLNIEIADYFSDRSDAYLFLHRQFFARHDLLDRLGAFRPRPHHCRHADQERAARYAGVALLGVTLGKLFLHDLNELDELYRIGAFVGVALILIAASFIYQRFLVPSEAGGKQTDG